MAAARVFEIYELVEAIIEALHTSKDITRVIRVSRLWHSVITESSRIRNLRALPPFEKTDPALCRTEAKIHDPSGIYRPEQVPSSSEFTREIFRITNSKCINRSWIPFSSPVGTEVVQFEFLRVPRNKFNLVTAEGRERYVTNPPVQALQLTCGDEFSEDAFGAVVCNRQGIMMGDVIEGVERMVRTQRMFGEQEGLRPPVYLWVCKTCQRMIGKGGVYYSWT